MNNCNVQYTTLSVVIPTAGKRSLTNSLASLLTQTRRPDEVIIVWNSPSAPPCEVSKSVSDLPIRVLHEPKIGLNRARNRGCESAKSRLIALLDDDCVAIPGWIEAIMDVYHRYPQVGVIAGVVELDFESPPPAWMTRHFLASLSHLHWGDKEIELSDKQYVVGANMTFPKALFQQLGGFDPHIGMVGIQPPQLCNDEKAFVDKARKVAKPGVIYSPLAIISHYIPQHRMNVDFLVQRRYGQGYSDSRDFTTESAKWQHFYTAVKRAREGFKWALVSKRKRLGEVAGAQFCGHFMRCELGYYSGVIDEILGHPLRGDIEWPKDGIPVRFGAYPE